MLPRYVKQKDRYNCGPIAVINTMKWLGFPTTYKDLNYISWLCNCSPGFGMTNTDMERALRSLRIKTGRRVGRSIKSLDKHLFKGGAAILDYYSPSYSLHYSLCIDRWKKYYVLINNRPEVTMDFVTRKELLNLLKRNPNPKHKLWMFFIYPQHNHGVPNVG